MGVYRCTVCGFQIVDDGDIVRSVRGTNVRKSRPQKIMVCPSHKQRAKFIQCPKTDGWKPIGS
jgi:hypothetical protein